MVRLLSLIVWPVLCACAPALAPPAVPQEPAAQEMVLAPRQPVRVDGTALSITLEAIVDDSRCPTGVDCVWAGDVAARIRIEDGKAAAHVATLHLNTGDKETMHAGRRITLVAVTPYPTAGEKIDPAAYRVTVRVAR